MIRRRQLITSLCAALTFALAPSALHAGDKLQAGDYITADDLKAFYGEDFTLTEHPAPMDPIIPDGGPHAQVMFVAKSTEPRKHAGNLFVRQSASPAEAQKACDVVKEKFAQGSIKTEDAPGIGDHAFWFGRQLNFTKGNLSFILSASGLKDQRDPAQSREAATALAKKILERVK